MGYEFDKCGARIKDLRKNHILTQEELATQLGISREHLNAIERGKKGASIEVYILLSSIFSVTLDYLILGRIEESDSKKQIQEAVRLLSGLL